MNKPTDMTNKYSLGKKIGGGNFSEVFLAKNKTTNKNVVIKKINRVKHLKNNRIRREIEIPKLIRHKNVIRPIEDIITNTDVYIIYDYLDNSFPLSEIDDEKLILNTKDKLIYIIKILYQITDAVEFMHSVNVVHRDIKPKNVVISNDTPVIIDFDLSAVIENNDFPVTNGKIGTPNYLAPELWSHTEPFDPKLADIYSLGVLFFFCLNEKKIPYSSSDREELGKIVARGKPLISKCGIVLLDSMVMTMINKDPLARPKLCDIKVLLQKILSL